MRARARERERERREKRKETDRQERERERARARAKRESASELRHNGLRSREIPGHVVDDVGEAGGVEAGVEERDKEEVRAHGHISDREAVLHQVLLALQNTCAFAL